MMLLNVMFVAALTAQAPEAQALEAQAVSVRLGWQQPFAMASEFGAFGTPQNVFTFYSYWPKPREDGGQRVLAVVKHDGEQLADGPQWASEDKCPGLHDVIASIEHLPSPSIDILGFGRFEGTRTATGGAIFTIKADFTGWEGDFPMGYGIKYSGTKGTPLANWTAELNRVTVDCWGDDLPPSL